MTESPKRASDSLAIPAPVLGLATKKAKPSDNDDAPDVVDLTSDDDSEGGSDEDSGDGSDRAPEELPPGLRPKTVSGRGVISDFMIDYALEIPSMCNEIGKITRPLVRISMASPTANTKLQQRVLLETTRKYLRSCVAHLDANIDILDKY